MLILFMIEELTQTIFQKLLENINTPENIKQLQMKLLDPIISYTFRRFYPYFMIMIVIFIMTFILIITILIILLKKIMY